MCVLTVLMAAYYCFALPLTNKMASEAHVSGIEIELTDPQSRFVNNHDVLVESGLDPDTIVRCLRRNFDLHALECRLNASDKLQRANVSMLNNGRVHIVVEPMVPVARVFDKGKPSYYINAGGKEIAAELRYHIDVPVLVGSFDSVHPAKRLLPLLDKIASDPAIGSMVATVTQEADGNIIIVPTIVGHVVNFGDTSMVDDKFRRLKNFYRHVAPTQGWLYYDTIAVKWRNRVICTRRHKAPPAIVLPTVEEQTGAYDIDGNDMDEAAQQVVESYKLEQET